MMPKCLKAAPDSVLRSAWTGCQGGPCPEEAGDWPDGSGVKWTHLGQNGFPDGSGSKASACNVGDLGSIPGSGRSPGEGNGNPPQYSCLENPMDGGAWWATVRRVAKSRTRLSDFTFTLFQGRRWGGGGGKRGK